MSRPRIIFFTRYEWKGPSSRYRTLQFIPRLEKLGLDTEVRALFPNRYIEGIAEGRGRPIPATIKAYLGRLRSMTESREADLVVIEKELFPYLPALFERVLAALDVPYVVDFDDAIFHRYDRASNPLIRWLLSNKIRRVIEGASLVTVGNEYLADYATDAGAKQVEVIPTVVDTSRYPKRPPSEGGPLTVGWIGSPTTTRHLELVGEALRRLSDEISMEVVLVGAGEIELADVPVERREWLEDREVQDILDFDVGIAPLHDAPFERGKCGLKIIQYMAASRPAVASPVSAQETLVDHGDTGLLASGTSEWFEALRTLADDPAQRRKMGERGRQVAEQRYCLDVMAPRLARLLDNLAQGKGMAGERRSDVEEA